MKEGIDIQIRKGNHIFQQTIVVDNHKLTMQLIEEFLIKVNEDKIPKV